MFLSERESGCTRCIAGSIHDLCVIVKVNYFVDLIERATPSDAAPEPSAQRINPKRAAREAARATQSHGASTMAQAALRIQIEAHKRERRIVTREQREQEAEDKRRKAREKALARRRGY